MLRVFEAFAGIGSQARALQKINIDFCSTFCDWNIYSIIAYHVIHHFKELQELEKKEIDVKDIDKFLFEQNISKDGNKAMTFEEVKKTSTNLKKLLVLILTNFDVKTDIKKIKNFNDYDLVTYSFPCQDLSMAGKGLGIKEGSRSGLLLEIERIIKNTNKLPKFLLMENVKALTFQQHSPDYERWQKELEKKGYFNYSIILKGSDYGIPQDRERVFLISILNEERKNLKIEIEKSKNIVDDLNNYLQKEINEEVLEVIPNNTKSRIDIWEKSKHLKLNEKGTTRTITKKQDRRPNAGIVELDERFSEYVLKNNKSHFRYLTPREQFRLMGFNDSDFERLKKIKIDNKQLFNNQILSELAGNSIIVNVLEIIFKKLFI